MDEEPDWIDRAVALEFWALTLLVGMAPVIGVLSALRGLSQ